MSELTRDRRLEILKTLKSKECAACGGKKEPMMSHCRGCYYALPQPMRRALYKRFGEGYEEAFEESLQFLNERRVGTCQQ